MADEILARSVLAMDVDGSEAVAAMDQLEAKVAKSERDIATKAGRMAEELAGIGSGAQRGAVSVDKATKQAQASLQRLVATLQGGEKGSVGYLESLFKGRGANLDVLRPLIDQYKQLKDAQEEVAKAALEQANKQKIAAAAVAENRRAFEQDNAAREAYLGKLREEVKLLGMSEAAQRSYRAALANKAVGGGAEGEDLIRQVERLRAAREKAAQAARDQAEADRRAAAAQKGNDDFITTLQRQASAIGKTRADLLEMEAAQRGLSTQAAPFIAKLRESEKSLHGVGVSAGQTKAALAQLPAQFTDIATQLAGGQNPLLILIQQGGQIRDSFGGFGNTFRELGKLITPVRLAITGVVGALAAVVLAYSEGSKEQDAYNKAIILTGNAAGVTAGQLRSLAKATSNSVGTQGNAAEALAALVATGRVTSSVLGLAAESAVRLEREGVRSIGDTARAFADLGKSPLDALLKLNETENFLTDSIYKRVKALEASGQAAEAAALAQRTYAEAGISQAKALERELGSIERAWREIKDAAKGAWDAMLNVGRKPTVDTELVALRNELTEKQGRLARLEQPGGGLIDSFLANQTRASIVNLQGVIAALERSKALGENVAKTQEEGVRLSQAKLDYEKAIGGYLTREEQRRREIASITGKAKAAGKADNDPGLLSAIAEINKRFQEKGEDLRKTYGALIVASAEHVSAMALEANGADKLTQGEKRLLDMQAKIEAGTLTYNQALYAQAAAQFHSEAATERVSKAKDGALKLSLKLAAQEDKSNEALYKSALAMVEQIDRLRLGEDAFTARNAAAMRAEAIDITWQSQMEGGNSTLDERARLLRLNADLIGGKQEAVFTNLLRDQALALDGANRELQLEASLIGFSSNERSIALAQLRIQLKLEQDIARVRAAMPDGPAREKVISGLTSQADDAKAGVVSKQKVDILNELLDPSRAQTFGDALTDAFDGAGVSLSRLVNSLQGYATQQDKLNKGFAANRDDKGRVKDIAIENRLIEQQGRLQISTYAQMAGAAKGFFEEGSKGYRALHAAETAFQAFQLASDLIKGVSAAAVGIATQAQGDPYTAFPRMAAMAAAMAALGFATGFFGSSGGGTQATAAQRQGGAATGRIVTPDQLDRNSPNFRGGTVFGNDEARSESIAKSIDLLEDHARLGLDFSRSQLNALEAIRDSMAGVANLIVRTAGGSITTGKNFDVQTGLLSRNEGDPILKMLGINDAGVIQSLAGAGSVLGKIGVFAQGLWGKVTQKIADSGLDVSGTIADILVRQFADVEQTTSSFFGLKKKTTTQTLFGEEKDVQALADQFSLIFKNIGEAVKSSAEVLGREGSDEIAKAIASFPVNIPRLSLKDLKGDELQAAISAAVGAQADLIAQALVPSLEAFQTVGEGYFETLIKVASGIEVANYQLDLLGITAVDYTSVIRKQGDVGAEIVRQSIAAAETAGGALSSIGEIVNTLSGTADDLAETYRALVDVRTALVKVGESGETLTTAMIRGAGGLEKLSSSLETYFTEFFSEQEQLAANSNALAAEFKRLGLAVPLSREEFRDLVTALNDGTDAGAAMAAKVLGLAGAFDEVADAAEEAAGRLTDAITESLTRFGTPQERQASTFGGIAANLQRDAGVSVSIGQLIGASIEDINVFARTFLALGSASDDAKTAVLAAANALFDLKKEASDRSGSLESELLKAQGRGLEAVARERKAEIDQLAALEASLGVAAGTFTTLQQQIYAAADAAKLLSGLDNVVSDFLNPQDLAQYRATRIQQTLAAGGINATTEQIIGATTKGIIDLWTGVGDAGKQAILDSYGALTQLQTDLTKEQRKTLDDQLAGMKGLRDLAKDIKQFIQTVKFGDLSPLSAEAQLREARSLFDTTFSKAQAGDTNAQGSLISNAQAYLQELQSAFASGPAFTAEFNRVTSMLEALGLQGDALDPQIKYLESLSDNSRGMLDALLSIDSTLKGGAQGVGDRTFISGPAGSSGGLSGEVEVSPVRRADAAGPSNQAKLLEKVLAKLDEILATSKEVSAAANGNAATDQIGFNRVTDAVERVAQGVERIAGTARQAQNKSAVMPSR